MAIGPVLPTGYAAGECVAPELLTDTLVEKTHSMLLAELSRMYYAHREKCGYAGIELQVID